MNNKQRLQQSRQFWDSQADTFDDEPDHGLRTPMIRQAWSDLLQQWLPANPVSILDIGCGTGSLSVLMAAMNHSVVGIDLSQAMITLAQAKAKAAGHSITFKIMDAYNPQLAEKQFEVIVCRHLLWAMPSTQTALQRWARLLVPGGRMLLVEGFWHTGGGLHSEQVVHALPATFTTIKVENLSDNAALWGTKVQDERYLVVADNSLNL